MNGPDTVEVHELLTRVADGDRLAFRILYARAGPKLFSICLRMMRSRDQAEDVFQEAFVKIWERSWQFDPAKGNGLAWMATLTRHCALDRLRGQPKQHFSIDEAVTNEIDTTSPLRQPDLAASSDLHHCLAGLRAEYRSAVILVYVNGLTHEELSERLGRPLGTIKSWVRRGLEHLKDCMDS